MRVEPLGDKVVVKRLDAIQNLGAMNVLCTDKTGTLTQDRIVLERHTDVYGAASDDVLAYAYLNSYYQTGLKNLLDVAVLDHLIIGSGAPGFVSLKERGLGFGRDGRGR